ncbi:hypothetical protein QN400_10480 [Pseudomonas sp. RTC3]|uniref:hypothetical protein n=1 Tax=unclassified Pseudomonas TaxID=196821 RepID=UPI002AB3BE7C|nr:MULTISPECIES: hypothetical protein [unclassified Pseudomonas]MEB0062452.1 hypothetical protein [Pseudomonas sp. RTC3]MDY7565783.1 hypothetical protein [Pseudomonas sp. 5C2]MEB0027600.1 hypothetical protein [Pseudomonas sp. MH9.2]MEB0240457.1 hypothetical protein [Pseudomonas sp. 5C2]WPX71468.1 hypothetical protein RHM55_07165 [Pseudomonas sp. MH9.2]
MNGIGGRTIAEAQENITYPEFMIWCKFRGKRGSLNQGMRIEVAIARFMTLYGNVKTGKKTFAIEDFAPHMDLPELTLERAMETWQ